MSRRRYVYWRSPFRMRLVHAKRGRKRLFKSHPRPQACSNGSLLDAVFGGPVPERSILAEGRSESDVSTISRLGVVVCPSAVAFGVALGAVDAIEGHSGRALAHVGKEVLELHPPLANLDASTTIKTIRRLLRTKTATAHRYPRPICWRHVPMPVLSASPAKVSNAFGLNTPATPCVFSSDVCAEHDRLDTAITAAQPHPVAAFVAVVLTNRDQPARPFAGQI